MTVEHAVSPRVSAAEVAVSMVVYTLLYAALAVVEVKLFLKYVRLGAEAISDPDHDDTVSEDADAPLAYAY
jgi:cytochrome d ubiquinol oxidase subunit I